MKLREINFSKLAVMLLPTFMRSPTVVELFRILSTPFADVQVLFFATRNKNLYHLQHNGQVCHLRAVLNKQFAYSTHTKPFIIEDAQDTGQWLYAVDEIDENKFNHLMLPDQPDAVFVCDEETMTKFADFVVKIPDELTGIDNMNTIKALVNTYKLISKRAIYERY
jgi:hypothetical protein